MKKEDSPGISLPRALVYGPLFGISLLLQKLIAGDNDFFNRNVSEVPGFLFLAVCPVLDLPSLIRFFRTKNALITAMSANSLQAKGLYSI